MECGSSNNTRYIEYNIERIFKITMNKGVSVKVRFLQIFEGI